MGKSGCGEMSSNSYRLKTVNCFGGPTTILMQAVNGPCPLLAVANILLLAGRLELPPTARQHGVVTFEDLVNALASKLLELPTPSGPSMVANRAQNVRDAIDTLPRLNQGMDLNLKFSDGCSGMESTMELVVFDLLGVRIVHGWLLDPQDVATTLAINNMTYNQALEVLVSAQDSSQQDAVRSFLN